MKFIIQFTGSSAVETISFERAERNLEEARRFVSRTLPHYFPTYYAANIFSEDGGHIVHMTAQVVVE